jgi:NAD(P)-dependent dehydrogenase (short-subunit alcohol dehydrogenase family)
VKNLEVHAYAETEHGDKALELMQRVCTTAYAQARVRRAVEHTILTNEMRTWALNRWLDEPGALDGPGANSGSMGRLDSSVAIVTGAGQGIGAGIAKVFAREGARVCVAELKAHRAERTAAEIVAGGGDAFSVPCDVGVKADVDGMVAATVARFGTVDVLVNNAHGFGPRAKLEEIPEDQFDMSWRTGAKGTWWAMCAVRPIMAAKGRGRIINFGSLAAEGGMPGLGEYGAAKAGHHVAHCTAAREWGHSGITVNVIYPAALTKRGMDFRDRDPEKYARLMAERPVQRLGDPETDIAPIAVFLASDDSQFSRVTSSTPTAARTSATRADGGAAHRRLDELPRCRAPLAHAVDHVRCDACGFIHFPNMGVGAAVVIRNARGQVLMVQRSARQYGAGKWCFPCGYVEWSEDIRAAAAREAREEAGVDVAIGDPVYVETNLTSPRSRRSASGSTRGWSIRTPVPWPATTPSRSDGSISGRPAPSRFRRMRAA